MQAGGVALALVSLASYWAATAAGPRRAVARPNLLTEAGRMPSFNVVLAGRDLEYCVQADRARGRPAVPCEGDRRYGKRTDTIMVAHVEPGRVEVVSIPRDTRVGRGYTAFDKINAAYWQGGAEGLRTAVEALLGARVEYYAVVNVDLLARLVDALGGVEVYVPERMVWTDRAANLFIDFAPGNQRLDGEATVRYLRFRYGTGDDYARQDRAKAVVGQLLEKARQPGALAALPALAAGLIRDVETNVDLELLRRVVPYLSGLRASFSTYPTRPGFSTFLEPDRAAAAETIGFLRGAAAPAPGATVSAPVAVVNSSGIAGLGRALAAHLARAGIEVASVENGESANDPTAILAGRGREAAADAETLGAYLGLPVARPYLFPRTASGAPLVVHLGADARERYAALVEQARAVAAPN